MRYFMRDHEKGIAAGRKALELDPRSVPAHLWLAWPCIAAGRYEEAFRELEAARAGLGDVPLLQLTIAYTHAMAGSTAEARSLLDAALALRSERHVPADFVAIVYQALGEKETAWEWLLRAEAERAHWLVFLNVEPRFDGFRDDPRFEALKQRVGI